jgi:hypothetical protein
MAPMRCCCHTGKTLTGGGEAGQNGARVEEGVEAAAVEVPALRHHHQLGHLHRYLFVSSSPLHRVPCSWCAAYKTSVASSPPFAEPGADDILQILLFCRLRQALKPKNLKLARFKEMVDEKGGTTL